MLFSLAAIFLLGIFLGALFEKLHFPKLTGMLIAGILLGPYALDWLHPSLLSVSPDIRRIALIVILAKAGFSINLADLKKIGRPAALMSFLPAFFEIAGALIFAPLLLGISLLDAAVIGSVLGAASPAVIIPRMIHIMEEGYGAEKKIPSIIMAGASIEDVFLIVLFSSFTSLYGEGGLSIFQFIKIPISIVTGVLVGIFTGWLAFQILPKLKMPMIITSSLLLSIFFLFSAAEDHFSKILPFSALLAVMVSAASFFYFHPKLSKAISNQFLNIWFVAELFLFALVGATMNLKYAVSAGVPVILFIFSSLAFRVLGVFVSLLKTPLNMKERLFCAISYLPKATVQAAIGGIPLAMGLPNGNVVLTVSVVAILITAPMGALGIDFSYRKLLKK